MGAHLKCVPAASAHSDSKKAKKVSFARNRHHFQGRPILSFLHLEVKR